ncbi:hypothetical protein SAY87_020307 [Trapa incisa]|uniref:Uncharacterized protein n=1 Tax=Trapa incisa TaxID=236973 RepID=A0AAN7K6F9_9MYRT|nr:hypothetical protein SAY87_020307 [Trapa incisa]
MGSNDNNNAANARASCLLLLLFALLLIFISGTQGRVLQSPAMQISGGARSCSHRLVKELGSRLGDLGDLPRSLIASGDRVAPDGPDPPHHS